MFFLNMTDFRTLCGQLQKKFKATAAMKRGSLMEPFAANMYAQASEITIYHNFASW